MMTDKKKPCSSDFALHNTPAADGANRKWVYELNLWRNPTALITVAKCILAAGLMPAVLIFGMGSYERGWRYGAQTALPLVVIILPIMFVLLLVAYPIYALANGGRYRVRFVMDASGVDHIQQARDFKRQRKLGLGVLLLGFASRQYGAGAAGLVGTSKQSHYTSFKQVKSIRAVRKRNVIYLRTTAGFNQIYVPHADFDAVLENMINACPKTVKIKRG